MSTSTVDDGRAARYGWVDTAKGCAILLVVFNHANAFLHAAGVDSPTANLANQAFSTFRMPTFFLLSGLFVARSLRWSWSLFVRRKLYRFVYLYVVWSALYLLPVGANAAASHQDVGVALAGWAGQTAAVSEVLWYLVALPVFFAVARSTRGVPVAVQVAAAAGLFTPFALELLHTGSWGVDHMAEYYLFFLLGCHGSALLRRVMTERPWWVLPVLALAWAASGGFFVVLVPSWLPVGATLVPFLGVPFALSAAGALERVDRYGLLRRIGRSTLPIYVLHDALLLVAVPWYARVVVHAPALVQAVSPVVVAAAAVALSLGVWRSTRRHLPVLFRPPGRGSEPDDTDRPGRSGEADVSAPLTARP